MFHRPEEVQAGMRSDAIDGVYRILTASHRLSVARCQGVGLEKE